MKLKRGKYNTGGCWGSLESVYGYSTSQVLDAEESTQVMSGTEWRERKVRTLHQSLCMVLGVLVSTCTTGFAAESEINIKLNCFRTLASYCCDIREGKGTSGIQHGLSVRRSYVRYVKTKEHIR